MKMPAPDKRPAAAPSRPVFNAAAAGRAPRRKAGRSSGAVIQRRNLFVEAYLSNGQNAAQAAIAAGTGGKQPREAGWRILHQPEVQALIATRSREVAELAEMNTANWAADLRAIAHSRIDDLFYPDGKLIPVAQLPDRVKGAISSIKVRTTGADEIVEYKFWSKTAALEIMARHLGLFEKDNAQQKSDILVRVELVG